MCQERQFRRVVGDAEIEIRLTGHQQHAGAYRSQRSL